MYSNILLLGSISVAIDICIVYVYRSIVWENGLLSPYHQLPRICVSCDGLQRHPDDPFHGIDIDGTQCCANDTPNLHHLVERFTGQWFKELQYRENTTYNTCYYSNSMFPIRRPKRIKKPFIKMIGSTEMSRRQSKPIQWNENLKSRAIKYHKGYIHIQEAGVYFAYSQVSLVVTPGNSRADHVKHTVVLKREWNKTEREIVTTYTPVCPNKERDDVVVSFVATSYLLYEGDKLFVKVSPDGRTTGNPKMNFFGVHML